MTATSPFPESLLAEAAQVLEDCRARGLKLVTAESCTGGLIAGLLTEIAGSSDVLDRGYVTYSNAAKTECLGVPAAMIDSHGAVSRQVAAAMAEGALKQSHADIAIAVTGIAGPGGGTAQKPVGLVHLAVHRRGHVTRHHEYRFGDIGRTAVRMATIREALAVLAPLVAMT
ncbi:MAG: CinA family protein [Hyphomicrobiaceae bacterium]|nr:CinA family protein [Hyphomicrobiaceae bacterium]